MLKTNTINFIPLLLILVINLFSNEIIVANNDRDSLSWWRDSTAHLSETRQRVYLEKALAVSRQKQLKKEEALTLFQLSTWEYEQANYSKAYSLIDTFHTIIVKHQFTELIGTDLVQRGMIHLGLKQYEKAKHLFEECIDFSLTNTDSSTTLPNAYNNLGIIAYLEKRPTVALAYYEKAIPMYKKLGEFKKLNNVLENMALVYLQQNQPRKALKYFQQKLVFCQETNDQLGLSKTNGNIGYTYFLLNEVSKAIPFYQKSIAIAKKNGFKDVLAITYKDLSDTYKGVGDTRNALENFEAYHQLETQNISKKALNQVNELQVKYDKEIQDKKLTKQEQELVRLRQGKIIRQQRFYLLLAGTICLLSCGLFYFFIQKSKTKQFQITKQLNEEKLKNDIALGIKEQSILRKELENKEKDITSLALNISRKSNFVTLFNQKLLTLENDLPLTYQPNVRDLKIFANSQLRVDEELVLLQKNIEDINHNFYQKLDEIAKLSQSEKHICGLIRLNLSNKEIALLRNTTAGSTKVFRHRIRKKLGLLPEEDITKFLQNF